MKNKWKIIGLIFIILLCALMLAGALYIWGETLGYAELGQKIAIWLQGMLLLLGVLLTPIIISNSRRLWAKDKAKQESLNPAESKKITKPVPFSEFTDIEKHCRYRYGFFWRSKLRKVLIIGDKEEVSRTLPELIAQTWLVGDGSLLIWGGDAQAEIDPLWVKALKRCCGRLGFFRYKPLDAIVWVMSENYTSKQPQQAIALEQSLLQIRERNKLLGWQAPLYLIENRPLQWKQEDRIEQGVGAYFTGSKQQRSIDEMIKALEQLTKRCTAVGMQQVLTDYPHSFLLELSQYLENKQIPLLKEWLKRFFSIPRHPLLRGLLFAPIQLTEPTRMVGIDHHFQSTPLWDEIIKDSRAAKNQRIGIEWGVVGCIVLLSIVALVTTGLFTSFYNNRQLIAQSEQIVQRINNSTSADYTERLNTQYVLQNQLEQLMYRQQESVPLAFRFGLSQNEALLDTLWPYYEQVNQQNIAQPFTSWASDYLTRLTAMSPADPNRIKWVNSGYEVLKGYLMLGLPEKADGEYLSLFAAKMWRAPEPIDAGEWQRVMPELVRFWGDHLAQHPQWANNTDPLLVKDVRQILINQIGVQNAGNTIYQAIIQRASQNYANLSLTQLLGGIDSRMLFTSDEEVPGVYTRRAWESLIKNEIASAAKSRQEQIDWVLSDGGEQVALSISPEVLRQQLTDRYFSDYSASWLLFLNNVQWRQADNVSDVIEQLTLLSDVRQSPLIALMNVIQYQAEVAYSGGGISDNLLRSAQELVKDKNPANLVKTSEASGPLTPSFGPVLNLLKADNRSDLSLQTYLLRVTQVRLKLQNITSSANPQAMAQAMAKSVFQGTSVDLTDTRDYGNLIAANLGEEWSGFGYSMFKQPLEQAWQVILTPAAKSFNDTWQTNIVASWEKSFAGRYPFKDSDNDASLAELARFLRPEAGVVDKFIALELGGILQKQGDNWAIDPVNSQGLRFTPEFIEALNLFNDLSNQLFSSGDAKMEFDLMARSGGHVVRSELIVDKQRLDYFNQMPVWKRFSWPGEDYSPYAQLSWSTNESNLQLYDYAAGNFGFIRLLESAFVRQLDSSRYELIWKAPRDSDLKYILRTQSGEGPLTLLKLRNFELPKRVFEVSHVN